MPSSGTGAEAPIEPMTGPATGPATGPERFDRSTDPRVVEARAVLDEGRIDLAPDLVERAAALVEVEGHLLRARLAALQGDGVAVRREVEQARALAPSDPRVHATAAELAAAEGRLDEAEQAIQRGIRECDPTSPELLRARGVQLICTPGRAKEGLEFLVRAREADPDLPFMARALGQAHLLVAKEHMQAGSAARALEEIDLSLEFDPAEVDAKRFRAECLMALGEWSEGLSVYDSLIEQGLPLHAEVAVYHKNAGFWALANSQPDWALPYYRRALELGLPREELGIGARFLGEEASKLAEAGVEALASGDDGKALELVEEALFLEPDSLFTYYVKGKVHDWRGEFQLAAAAWKRVVSQARSDEVTLPDPVHLHLARVQAVGLNDPTEARRTLEAYLVFEPEGEWVDQTTQLLETLPAPPDPPPGEAEELEVEELVDDGSGG